MAFHVREFPQLISPVLRVFSSGYYIFITSCNLTGCLASFLRYLDRGCHYGGIFRHFWSLVDCKHRHTLNERSFGVFYNWTN